MASVDLTVEALQFDLANPRYVNLGSQREALESIVANQKDKLYTLAEDIVDVGLNPAEQIIVIQSPDDKALYIVLEGNRRLAALKLLANSALLDSLKLGESKRKKWKELRARFNITSIEPITCALLDSREEANHWIELKHTGENEGKGIVPWDGIAAAQFRGKEVSLQALEFVKNNGNITNEVAQSLDKFPITNLDRLLGNPAVRDSLGLTISPEGKLETNLPPEEVGRGLGKIVTDIATKAINVNHIKTKDDQINYINSLQDSEKPDLTKTEVENVALESIKPSSTPKPKSLSPTKKPTKLATDRPYLIPKSCSLSITVPRINAIYNELRTRLKVDSTPNAVAVSLRVFLELSLDAYLKKHPISGITADSTLAKKLEAIADYLETNSIATKPELKPIRVAVSAPSSYASPNTFNAYVHNMYMIPNATELKNTWDSIQIFFEKIW